MSDWLGLAFFVLLAVATVVGLKLISKPRVRTSDEFERSAAEGTTMLGAGMNALQAALDPGAAKAKEVQMQMRDGRYQKKKREGKTEDDAETEGRDDALKKNGDSTTEENS
jgi:hypothetical protein